MAIHCSSLAWRIPWTEDPGGLQSIGCKEAGTTEAAQQTHTFHYLHVPQFIYPNASLRTFGCFQVLAIIKLLQTCIGFYVCVWACLKYLGKYQGVLLQVRVMVAQWQRVCLPSRRCRVSPWVGKIPWRRKWQPTPVFLPGKFYGQKSLVGYSPWGCKRVGHDPVTKE